MQRLALAILLVAALAGLAAVAVAGLGRILAPAADSGHGPEGGAMQKVAFALLMALILYVAFLGPA